MEKKKLIEELEDLATFLALAQSDAEKQASDAGNRGSMAECTIHEERAEVYETAFTKLDKIITEAKK